MLLVFLLHERIRVPMVSTLLVHQPLTMSAHPLVDSYIERSPWRAELTMLRAIMHRCGLKEELKWGAPAYTCNGKNVIGLGSFKSYVGIWFHQGVFLRDKQKVLVNAKPGVTKAQRQWRFKSLEEMNQDLITNYVSEAVTNARNGKVLRPQSKKLSMSEELSAALISNRAFRMAFESLSPGRQKEYAEFISNAKQDATRIGRLQKCMPMILKGSGLNDKYKKRS